MDTVKAIKETYDKKLKAVDYVEAIAQADQHDGRVFRMPLEFIYKLLKSGRFHGSKLLEIGSGAVLHNVASASAFFQNIVMSDYVEDNCKELRRWLSGESKLKQILDVPADIEGYSGDLKAGRQLLETRIRQTVKQVVRCDVLQDNIFLEEVKPEVAPPYDLIISSLCLEAAAPDFDGFQAILKRINKLLRSGGGLILVGYFGGKTWRVGGTDFNYIDIREEDLRKALKESGFGSVDMRVHGKLNIEHEHANFYYLAGEKI